MNFVGEVVSSILAQKDLDKQVIAAQTLGSMQAVEAVPYLVKATESPDELARMASAKALAQIGDKASIPYLLKMVNSNKGRGKLVAIEALGEFNTPEVIRFLTNIVSNRDNYDATARRSALFALTNLQQYAAQDDLSIIRVLIRFHESETNALVTTFENARNANSSVKTLSLLEKNVVFADTYEREYGFVLDLLPLAERQRFLDYTHRIHSEHKELRLVFESIVSFVSQYDSTCDSDLSARVLIHLDRGFVPVDYRLVLVRGEIVENDYGTIANPDVLISTRSVEFVRLVASPITDGLIDSLIEDGRVKAHDKALARYLLQCFGWR